MNPNIEERRMQVKEAYGRAAKAGSCCEPSGSGGLYAPEEVDKVPAGARLSLGSGAPVREADLQPGETVVDLGSGAGMDVFLAADRVGSRGWVIGIDMTPEMLRRARAAAVKAGIRNVEFREGLIEEIPLRADTADVVLSNCVINLSPDKAAVFREAFRILRPGGRLVISDIVQERPIVGLKDDCGCVSTAMLRKEYLATIRNAGFRNLEILGDQGCFVIRGEALASAITLRAWKPGKVVKG